MSDQIHIYPELSFVFCGDENGSFFGVGTSPQDSSKLTMDFSNSSTEFIRQYVTLDSQSSRTWQVVNDSSKPYDPRIRPWSKAAKAAGQNVWSEIYIGFTLLSPTITASVPVYSKTNK